MTTATEPPAEVLYEKHWKKGIDPFENKWPGPQENRQEHTDGMSIEWNVAVTLRDGVKTYVDIFRPAQHDGPLPIILTYSSYGKHGPKTFDMFPNSGVPKGSVSKYTVWEGPDPLYWTKQGYAMINADARGSWGSEGNLEIFSPQEAQDGYDIIEWAAALPWSNGKVGMSGVSYLAIVQWRIAETNPPHLACIIPWEGFTDVYRDYAYHGGIPETNFVQFTEWSCQYSRGQVEAWTDMLREHTLYDSYYATKTAKWSQIRVPALVVADWGDHGVHTRGTLVAYSNIASKAKWLIIHGKKKWQYYYQRSSLLRQEAFLRKFLKDQPSEVDSWPPVEIEVRDRCGKEVVRAEQEWPLRRSKPVFKYLDNSTSALSDVPVQTLSTRSYDSGKQDDHLTFQHTFETETELTGSMRLHLWVSTEGDDMDLFVQLDKIDVHNHVVPFVFVSMLDNGPVALGWLRVSHRQLDPVLSTIDRPWHLHEREDKLRRNEVVPCDIEILPSSTVFHAGESLRVRIQGNDILRYDLRQVQLHQASVNSGKHFIHTGGVCDSYLVLPYVDS